MVTKFVVKKIKMATNDNSKKDEEDEEELEWKVLDIDPEGRYDKDKLKDAVKNYKFLVELGSKLRKPEGFYDPELRKDLGTFLRKDPRFYAETSPDIVLNDAQEAADEGRGKLGDYVHNHFDEVLREVPNDNLESLVLQLPLEKIGDEKADELVDAIEEYHKIERAMREGKIGEYVEKKLESAPDWMKRAFYYASQVEDYVKRIFESYSKSIRSDLDSSLSEIKKEEEGLRNLIRKSYEKISDEEKDSDEARVYQLRLAMAAFGEKKE